MGKLELLVDALDYIEAHLREEIRTEDVAEACYCSKSNLEKLFRRVNRISVHDYVVRRRMSLAARELYDHPDTRLIDLAVEYGSRPSPGRSGRRGASRRRRFAAGGGFPSCFPGCTRRKRRI